VEKEGGRPPPGGFLLYVAASLIAQSWKGSGLFFIGAAGTKLALSNKGRR